MAHSLYGKLRRTFGNQRRDGITRREMLKSSLAVGAGLLFSPTSALGRSVGRRVGKRVVVIGAGFGGLAAGFELHGMGYDVTVLEARRRVGGRVVSFSDFVKGKIVEGGAELIGSNHPVWLAYARRFGLEMWDVTESEGLTGPIYIGGKAYPPEACRDLWVEMERALPLMCGDASDIDAREPWNSPGAAEFDARSLASWIDGLDVSPLCRLALSVQFTADNGTLPAWQSYLACLANVKGGGLEKFWTESEVYRCAGGNQRLALRLADGIGAEKVLLGVAVVSVSTHGSAVVVRLADGRTIAADEAVLAVPPSTWDKITFEPPLWSKGLPHMGANIKFLADVRETFWQATKLSPEGLGDELVQLTWEGTDNQPGADGYCLTAFSGGPAAVWDGDARPAGATEAYLSALRRLYPGIDAHFRSARFMDWPRDPWARCGYSFPSPGQLTTLWPDFQSAKGPIHFAGEHASSCFFGFMEGALESGVFAARRIAAKDGVV